MTGGVNVSGGKSNTDSKYYDNTVINAGGTFQLTTKEDALFAGANVTADKINFDIGKNLSIISLQDEYKSNGKNWGAGVGYSEKDPTTNEVKVGSITGNVSYSQNNAESKWVSNQTSIIAENGGNIKVGETLTNIGAIIGSLNADEKLSIEANKVVVSNLEDYNRGVNSGVNVGGIGLNNKAPIGQTGVQYGSHDKQQDSNATFVNTEVTEAGKKLNLEELGINTDINKAQIVTKDEVVEQIDTNLHTDLLNTTTRAAFLSDIKKAADGIGDIGAAINREKLSYETARTDRYAEYYIKEHPGMAELIKDPGSKNETEIKEETKAFIKYMTGKDVEVVITADGKGSGYIDGNQRGEGKKDVFILDITQLAEGGMNASFVYGHEMSHTDDNRRQNPSHNEDKSDSAGSRLEEILGENGESKAFDIEAWKSRGNKADGNEILNDEYAGYDVERKSSCYMISNPACQKESDSKSYEINKKRYEQIEKERKEKEETNRKLKELQKQLEENAKLAKELADKMKKEEEEKHKKNKYAGSPGVLNSKESEKNKGIVQRITDDQKTREEVIAERAENGTLTTKDLMIGCTGEQCGWYYRDEEKAAEYKNLIYDPDYQKWISEYGMAWGGTIAGYSELASLTGLLSNAGKTTVVTSNKGMTPVEYYTVKYNVSGLDDVSVNIINNTYGTSFISNKVHMNTNNYMYNMIENPGPLAEINGQPAANFTGGRYNSKVLEADTILYRGSSSERPLGQWFTDYKITDLQSRTDLAVKQIWLGNDGKFTKGLTGVSNIDGVYNFVVPKGTTIYYGPASYMNDFNRGGGIQIFIDKPWTIEGLKLIK